VLAIAEGLREDHGMPVVVSSALDSAVGIAAGLAAAAALPDLPLACGLATGGLLATDVVSAPARPVGGYLLPGAVAPDPACLDVLAPPADRVRWWRDRLSRCHRVLAAAASGAPAGSSA
jgi:O-succinylbenzoate synthase